MDRRSTGNTRYAGGIYSDNSWDRWLDEYYNPKPKRIPKKYKTEPVYHKTMNDISSSLKGSLTAYTGESKQSELSPSA